MSISAAEFVKWCEAFNVDFNGGTSGDVNSIIGTANQVIVSSPTGNVTLSLPQSIGTGNTPTFAGANLGNIHISGNTISSTDTNGNINLVPNGTGVALFNGVVPLDSNSIVQGYAVSKSAAINFASYSASNVGSSIYLGASSGTTPGTFTAVVPTRILGQIVFQGADGTQLYPGAQIVSTATGTIATSQIPSNLQFKTANSSGVLTTGMTLSSAQILTLANALPVTSGGTGLTSTTANQLLYSSATSTIAGLATANNGILVTSNVGVPSISSTLPSAVQTNITGLGVINQNLTLSPVTGGIRYLVVNTDNTYTGQFNLQAGGGSASYGGGLVMFGNSHATKPGWVTAGLSSGGTRYFTVNNLGTGAGTDVFTVSSAGAVVANSSVTGTSFSPSTTSGIIGTTTNNNAAAGSVGEFIEASVLIGSAVSLANATTTNITSIVLTPGDWDIGGNIAFTGDASTVCTSVTGTLNTSSATLLDSAFMSRMPFATGATTFANGNVCMALMGQRITVATATTATVYLIARANFSISTCSAAGYVWARRRR